LRPEDIDKLLNEQDWEALGKRLVLYAAKRVGVTASLFDGTDVLLAGISIRDVVQDVITKTLSHERQWDPDRGELWPWLKAQIRSELSHLYKSASARHERVIYDESILEEEPESQDSEQREAIERAGVPSAEDEALRRERAALASKMVGAVLTLVEDDPELLEMIEVMMDDCPYKPQSLAERLGVSVKNINNRQKRLRRHLTNRRR